MGLYSHQGLQYHSRGFSRSLSRLDEFFGEPSGAIKKVRKQYLGRNYRVQIHDTYRIKGYQETATLVGDGLSEEPSYNEDLYTEDIKDFIAGQKGKNPFFIYYSQWVCMCY